MYANYWDVVSFVHCLQKWKHRHELFLSAVIISNKLVFTEESFWQVVNQKIENQKENIYQTWKTSVAFKHA